jgi:uncharacterized protein
MKFTDSEKLILMMLCEIHEHLGIENGVDPKFVKEAIQSGNTWGLKWQYPGIFDTGDKDPAIVREVGDFLEMWSFIERAYKALSPSDKTRVGTEAEPFGKEVQFRGFDGNYEGEYISVASFLINHLDRFVWFKGRDLNSHMPSIEPYRRMYALFVPLRSSLGGGELDAVSLIRILKAMTHPSHR